ncbi:MAG: response regulator [Rubripirellula sp.]
MPDKISVLLIEDDIYDVEQVQRAFGSVSLPIFEVDHVPRFLDAIKKIKEKHYHVIILDLGLPDSVGLNGVERLMSMVPALPVIVLTGMEDDEAGLAGIALGAQEFIGKENITSKHLIRTIRHAIKRKQFSLGKEGGSEADANLQELAEIMRTTTIVLNDRVGTLKKTELTKQQLAMLSDIKGASDDCAKAVERLSPKKEVLFEAKVK